MQSRLSSLWESCSNVIIGFFISFLIGLLVYPMFGLDASAATCFGITLVFSAASILRSYIIRRWFNGLIGPVVRKTSYVSADHVPRKDSQNLKWPKYERAETPPPPFTKSPIPVSHSGDIHY